MRHLELLVVAAAAWLVPGMVAVVVLTNQPDLFLTQVGKIVHLVNIAAACLLVAVKIDPKLLLFVALTGVLFLIGETSGVRLPYETCLAVLFLLSGLVVSSHWSGMATRLLVATVLLSGSLMILQVLGVGEWTQALTTHGFTDLGNHTPKTPHPTFLVGLEELKANYLQGRPAGLLHSNQFASLVILVTLALSIARTGPRLLTVDAALSTVAAVSLAKIVYLGLLMLAVFYWLAGSSEQRRNATRYLILTALALVVYVAVFPGLTAKFLLNVEVLWISVAVRIVDVTTLLFGIGYTELVALADSYLPGSAVSRFVRIGAPTIGAVSEAGHGQSITSISMLLWYLPFMVVVALAALIVARVCRSRIPAGLRIEIRRPYRHRMGVLIVLFVFCFVANIFGAQVFWFFAGFGVPQFSIRRGAPRLTPETS